MRRWALTCALLIYLVLPRARLPGQQVAGSSIAALERTYDSLRYLRDQIDVTRSRDASISIHGASLERLVADYRQVRVTFERLRSSIRRQRLRADDRRAFDVMQRTFRESLGPDRGLSTVAPQSAAGTCRYDATTYVTRAAGMDS